MARQSKLICHKLIMLRLFRTDHAKNFNFSLLIAVRKFYAEIITSLFLIFFIWQNCKKGPFYWGFSLFSGGFLFLSNWINILGAEPNPQNNLIKYSLFLSILYSIFNPIFTLICCYVIKMVIFDKKPTKTLFFSGFASPQTCYKIPKKQQ